MIGFLTTWRLYLEAGLFAALLAVIGAQNVVLEHEKAGRAADQASASAERARTAEVALQAEAAARAKEQGWQAQLAKSQGDYDALKTEDAQKLAAYAASSRAALADNGKLRDKLAAFASGGGAGSQDTAAAASGRAAALGLLLAEALRLDDAALLAGSESAGAAEGNGNAVRALLKAWPRDESIALPHATLSAPGE